MEEYVQTKKELDARKKRRRKPIPSPQAFAVIDQINHDRHELLDNFKWRKKYRSGDAKKARELKRIRRSIRGYIYGNKPSEDF